MKKWLFIALAAAVFCLSAAQDPKGKVIGNPSAPMRLELYGDFTCPHCKHLHDDILPLIVRDFISNNKAYLVFRDYTLTGPGHQYSKDAAAYAAAGGRIGKYQAVSDALFKSQASWAVTGQIWPAISPALTPAEAKKVQTLFNDPFVCAEVQSAVEAGNMVPVTQTPTMVVIYKGKKQPWAMWTSYPLFKNYLDELLAR